MSIATEPVATSSAATVAAGVIVYVGNVTHLWSITNDEALAVALGVLGIVNVAGTVLARRRVTPVKPALLAETPHTPDA